MLYGKSAAEAARNSRIVRVNERDYALNGYVGASPVRGHYRMSVKSNTPSGFKTRSTSSRIRRLSAPYISESWLQTTLKEASEYGSS